MKKAELINAISEKSGLNKKEAEKALVSFINVVTDQLKSGDKVQIVGFGTFEARKRAARTGRNPQTGAKIKIAAKTAPVFSAGKKFKEIVDGKVAARK